MLGRPRQTRRQQLARHLPIVLAGALALLISVFAIGLLLQSPVVPRPLPNAVSAASYEGHDGSLIVPLAEFMENETKAITYDLAPTEQAPVILRLERGGPVQAVLGMCRQCRASHLGAYIQNGKLMCGKCRGPMRLPELNEDAATAPVCTARELMHTQLHGSISIPAKEMRGPE